VWDDRQPGSECSAVQGSKEFVGELFNQITAGVSNCELLLFEAGR
jgi:hypothetical protein